MAHSPPAPGTHGAPASHGPGRCLGLLLDLPPAVAAMRGMAVSVPD